MLLPGYHAIVRLHDSWHGWEGGSYALTSMDGKLSACWRNANGGLDVGCWMAGCVVVQSWVLVQL